MEEYTGKGWFEDFDNVPENIQNIFAECELQGWKFDFYLSAEPYDLRPIKD